MTTPRKYRKKPVIVEAVQWWKNGDHPEDGSVPAVDRYTGDTFLSEGKVVRYFCNPKIPGGLECEHCRAPMMAHGWIDTPKGGYTVCPGDYVITEMELVQSVKGKFYPCKPDVFELSYELVNDAG